MEEGQQVTVFKDKDPTGPEPIKEEIKVDAWVQKNFGLDGDGDPTAQTLSPTGDNCGTPPGAQCGS